MRGQYATEKQAQRLQESTEAYRQAKAESDRLRAAQKRAIIAALKAGVSQRQVSIITGLERATVNRWAQQAGVAPINETRTP